MADVKKARIFLRRGTDATRLDTELCEGELGYSTDGVRVFVGNGSDLGGNVIGSTTFFLSAGSSNTELSAASASGRAEVGDLTFISASSYALSSVNPSVSADSGLSATVIDVDPSVGMVYALSARSSIDTNANLTWVNVNSGIPIHFVNIPDYSIPATKVYGGNIGGSLSTTGELTAGNSLYLPHVKVSAQNAGSLTGNIIYPLGITATNQVTALSSYSQLGAVTGTLFLSAAKTGGNIISFNGAGSSTPNTTVGSSATTTTIDDFTGDGASGTMEVTYYPYTINISNINTAIDPVDLDWHEIDEFYFQTYMQYTSAGTGFIGYYNEARDSNIIIDYQTTEVQTASTYNRNFTFTVPNTYVNDKNLKIYMGRTTGSGILNSVRLVGIKRK